jgi:hypothetical protein
VTDSVPVRLVVLATLALAVAGCAPAREHVAIPAPELPPPAPEPRWSGPVLGPDGRCRGEAPALAATIERGIGECDLVRLKGHEPTDVLIGESGKGSREVQVLYAEPGGRELYLFVDDKLDRIVK